jgi:hypothetical protein
MHGSFKNTPISDNMKLLSLCSEAEKLLQPSPEHAFTPQLKQLERQLSKPLPRVARQLYAQPPPTPRAPEGTNLSTLGFVVLSYYEKASRGALQIQQQVGVLRSMLQKLKPVLATLGFDRPDRWKDFEDLFMSSSPDESATTYRLIMDRVSRLERPAAPEQHRHVPRVPP